MKVCVTPGCVCSLVQNFHTAGCFPGSVRTTPCVTTAPRDKKMAHSLTHSSHMKKKLHLLFIIDMWLATYNSSIIHTQCTMPIDENSTCAQYYWISDNWKAKCLPSLFLTNTHFLILFWEKAAYTCAWSAFVHSHDNTYNLPIYNGPVL